MTWHEDLNFDIVIGQLPGTVNPISPLQVGPAEDHYRGQLVTILWVQAKENGNNKIHFRLTMKILLG